MTYCMIKTVKSLLNVGNNLLRNILILSILSLFILTGASCGNKAVYRSDNIQPASIIPVSEIEIYPGDEIEIKFAYTPEFNETQSVRRDGKIELLLVGEVSVEGKTPATVKKDLTDLYSHHLSHPDLAVMIRSSYNDKVYVGGAVNSPGVLELNGDMTILDAVIETGGFDLDSAKLKNVLLIRNDNGEKYVYEVNIESYLTGDQPNFAYLKPMDIVYVPRTTITNMANYLDKLWTIIPFRFSASYVISKSDIKHIFGLD